VGWGKFLRISRGRAEPETAAGWLRSSEKDGGNQNVGGRLQNRHLSGKRSSALMVGPKRTRGEGKKKDTRVTNNGGRGGKGSNKGHREKTIGVPFRTKKSF